MAVKKTLQIGKTKRVEKRVPLFELEGVEYSVISNPAPGVALKFMEIQTEVGQEAAIVYMLKTMVGDDAYKALSDSPDVSAEDFEALWEEITRIAMAEQESTVKNS